MFRTFWHFPFGSILLYTQLLDEGLAGTRPGPTLTHLLPLLASQQHATLTFLQPGPFRALLLGPHFLTLFS